MMDTPSIYSLQDYMEIAAAMQRCLVVKNRIQRLKIHKRCFVGREAVDFLMDYLNLNTRKEALQMGREVNEHTQCFEHVSRTYKLKDQNVFYRFTDKNNRSTSSTVSLKEIARAFQKGVQVEDKKVRMRTYKKCFKGKHAVDFLVNYKYAATRAEAVALARRMQADYDLFVHVSQGDRKFRDENVYYRMLMPKIGNAFDRTSQMLMKRPEVAGFVELWLLIVGFVASSTYVYLYRSESLGFMMAATLALGAAIKYYVFGLPCAFSINWFSSGEEKGFTKCNEASSMGDSSNGAGGGSRRSRRRTTMGQSLMRDSTHSLKVGETTSVFADGAHDDDDDDDMDQD